MTIRRRLTAVTFVSALIATMGTVGAGAASAAQARYALSIDKKVTLEIAGPDFSQVAVGVTVKCDPSLPDTQFNVFVSQPQAPFSFGFFIAHCTGRTEKYVAHVQSNFGTVYTPGPAVATVTNNADGISSNVTIVSR